MRGTLMAIRTPVSTSLNDFKQREAACLHVPLFFSLGKPNTPPTKVVGRADQINSKLGQISLCCQDRKRLLE